MMMMEHQAVIQKMFNNFNCSPNLNSNKLLWTKHSKERFLNHFSDASVGCHWYLKRKGIWLCSTSVEPLPRSWKEFSGRQTREMKNGAILYKSLKVFVIILRRGFNMLQLILSLFQNKVTLLTRNKWNNYHTEDKMCHIAMLFYVSLNNANGSSDII